MAEEKKVPMQTVLMTVLIDPATFIPESITAESMTPEYSRQLGVGETVPAQGDFMFYDIGGRLAVRQVVWRVFPWSEDAARGTVALFVKGD
jgi:hypothetical protein